jgi:FlaA1/EpsC-like NDP-sugar epimerase
MISFLQELKSWQKTLFVLLNDSFFSLFCFYSAMALRHESLSIPGLNTPQLLIILSIVLITQTSCFYLMGLYRGMWRYSSTPDLLRLIKGSTLAVTLSLVGLFLFNRLLGIPRSAFVIDWLLLIICLGGARFSYRLFRDYYHHSPLSKVHEKVIIVGAGDLGEQLSRELNWSPELGVKVVGFVDDKKELKGKFLRGVKVLGSINDLREIINKTGSSKVYVALNENSRESYQRILKACSNIDVDIKILPKMTDSLHGEAALTLLRKIEPEDLLGREEVTLDSDSLLNMLSQKKILVTGAGGSIGSELCEQIVNFNPSLVIFYEQSEFNLYHLEKELTKKFPDLNYKTVIGDVRSIECLESVFNKYRPDIVFHAAAYKHVPLMEINPLEAIKTNVQGTLNISKISQRYGVEKFVLVSTDKAVNPTNVMGATKRIAEIVCLSQQENKSSTKFVIVRFGNVLGSSGSVIPLFKEQIRNGGPVTVTHEQITRYFMSIPEASRLVLQAGALGNGGEILILDMGQPVLIKDLATQMIEMAGFRVGKDIKIEYTGLRPGEKLYEELLMDEENILPTAHPLVKVAKSREVPEHVIEKLEALIDLPRSTSKKEIRERLQVLVPEYYPQNIDSVDKGDESDRLLN